MKLIDQMKQAIEGYWEFLQKEDPFHVAIIQGTVKPEMISHFLVNVHHLVQHTPIHLRRAKKAAEKRKDEKLKAFFEQKLIEEQGHDKWAEDDLAKLKKQRDLVVVDPRIDASMRQLIQHIESTIDKDPYLYLPYIYFAEYLCVLCGPIITQALESKNGYQPRSLTVIENHAELDKDHVDEWEDTIEEIVDETVYAKPFLAMVQATIAIHKQFYLSCTERKYDAAS